MLQDLIQSCERDKGKGILKEFGQRIESDLKPAFITYLVTIN